jgi:hypothetical protein
MMIRPHTSLSISAVFICSTVRKSSPLRNISRPTRSQYGIFGGVVCEAGDGVCAKAGEMPKRPTASTTVFRAGKRMGLSFFLAS